MSSVAPLNADTPLTQDEKGQALGYVTTYFRTWLLGLTNLVTQAAAVLDTLSLTTQAASLGSTSVLRTTTAGVYRVTYYIRVTQAATVSSSLTVTLGWLESTVALSSALAAATGNTTTTIQTGSILVRADANSDLTVATTYASVGATPMQYRIDVVAERVA